MSMAQLLAKRSETKSDAVSLFDDATISDLAFLIRQRSKSTLPDDDVRCLAEVLLAALRNNNVVSQPAVEKMLLDRGRSPSKAKELSRAILK